MGRLLFFGGVASLALGLIAPVDAAACGGFFCSSVPIDQSKERIVFAVDEDEGKVETHVQIFYAGAAEEFAWILPVPGTADDLPQVGISSDELFTQLEWRTAPTFNLEWREEGDCEYGGGYYPGLYDYAVAESADDSDGAGGGVEVLEKTQVGPYDQVTLAADSASELITWLQANDYDLPDDMTGPLEPYVHGGMFFVALKLSNDQDAGDIAPVKINYSATSAMIPLVLTAVAATDDMRLQPYVLSNRRAVPDNYLHVQINEAAVNWLGWGVNYDDVVTQAANEAGGQAFATDFAGSTDAFANMLWKIEADQLASLATQTNPAQFVDAMLGYGFPRTQAVQNLIRQFIPMPAAAAAAGIEESSFYNCLDCYPEYVSQVDFDPAAFVAVLDEAIVTPMVEAQEMVDAHSYLTRMTSSMSPDEMTSDPFFVLNGDMDDVDNQHWATLVIDCGDGGNVSESPRYIELQDGRQILVPPEQWFWETETSYDDFFDDLGGDAAIVIETTSASGAAAVLTDNTDSAQEDLDAHNDRIRDLMGWSDPDLGAPFVPVEAGCGGCSGSGPSPGGAGLLVVGLLALRRRRS